MHSLATLAAMKQALVLLVAMAGCSLATHDDTATRALTGVDVYVDPSHPGANEGTESNPFTSLALALGAVNAGDTIHLRTTSLYPQTTLNQNHDGVTLQSWVAEVGDPPKAVFDPGMRDLTWTQISAGGDLLNSIWKSDQEFPASGQGVRGQLVDDRLRLVSYGTLPDMAATNQSFVTLPSTTTRPGFLATTGEVKPFTYMGPGIRFEPNLTGDTSKGHIYIRLAPTTFATTGVTDYAGPSDPEDVALSIAFGGTYALQTGASNVTFRDLVFQNGGEYTLRVTGGSDIHFEDCEVWAATHGVVVAGVTSNVSFEDCLFDGGVAPWSARVDFKAGYDYVTGGGPVENKLAVETSRVLVRHEMSDGGSYQRCTFRRGHDGMEISGLGVEVRDSLFENLNDEAIRFRGSVSDTGNTHIAGNVFRQVLNALSFVGNIGGGPTYVYRNVIDQRVPTLGYRVLPPDAPSPWLWRWGADFKSDDGASAIGDFYVYQNTFIVSHNDEEGPTQTVFFDDQTGPMNDRWFYNNLHVGLTVGLPYSPVLDSEPTAVSAGNQWFHYPEIAATFLDSPRRTLAEAQAVGWESGSIVEEPVLANFSGEWILRREGYPNTDYRPVVATEGVSLPVALPDPYRPALGPPQIGALPIDATALAVGVNGAVAFPTASDPTPIADAGAEQVGITDSLDDGFELIALDGTGSSDPDDAIVSYRWLIGDREVATGAAASVNLPAGHHYLRLLVADAAGHVDSDAIRVHIGPVAEPENKLTCPGFDNTSCGWTRVSANFAANPAAIHSGTSALRIIESTTQRHAVQRVSVTAGASYHVTAWMLASNVAGAGVLSVAFVDGSGSPVGTATDLASVTGSQSYAHRGGVVTAPLGAVAMDVTVKTIPSTVSGSAYFDDVRVRDLSSILNGGFEQPSPSATIDSAPFWSGDVDLVSTPTRSGTTSVALSGAEAVDSVLGVAATGGGVTYRASVWIRTDGITLANPTNPIKFIVRSYGSAGQHLGNVGVDVGLSQGVYTQVSTTFTADAATTGFVLRLQAPAMTGTAYFDDVLVQPVP
jgi:hypothetical protein